MKGLVKYSTFFIFIVTGFCASAQQPDDQVKSALEELAEQNDQVTDNDEIWEQLQDFKSHPVNLNHITAEQLETFPFLNSLQIQSLLQYRKLLGDFISIYELQAVPGLDIKTIHQLLPYVYVGNKNPFASSYRIKDFFRKGNWDMLLRYKRDVEKKRGFLEDEASHQSHYLGGPDALLFRIRYQFLGHLSIGVTADRDAGEPFFSHGQKGFDFYAVHFFLKDYRAINALVIGDYQVNLGQGLVNRQGLTFGKGSMVMNTDRSGAVLRPHTSAMENGFYRGAAVNWGKKHWNTTLFISYSSEDANLTSPDSLSGYFKGFQSSGYHRSISELEDKNSVRLFSGGGSLRYNFSKGHIALNAVYHHFSDTMQHSNQPYDLYGAEGKSLLNTSIDYAFYLRKFYFFGETAVDKNDAIATVNGLLMSPDKHVDLSLVYRNYQPPYNSLYAQAFGENSEPKNENGLYIGVAVRPISHWQMNAYGDIFQFPWLKYRVDEPSQGSEYFVQLTYTPSKMLTGYVRYRNKKKPLNILTDDPMAEVTPTIKKNIRMEVQWQLSDYFSLRDRIEGSSFRENKNKPGYGYFIAQDVLWKTNKRLSGNFRLGWFHTDGYNERIYAYENDVRFAYSIPFFYGKGIRCYANLRANISRNMSIWAKLSRTWYFDQQTIGSGWDQIQGNKRTSLTLELIWTP